MRTSFGVGHRPGCGCDRHAGLRATAGDGMQGAVAEAVFRAALPDAPTRRRLLQTVGAATVLGALAEVFPLGTATALAEDKPGPLEKPKLKIGFVPITCASPIIMAAPMGFYARHGLDVEVVKTAGWAVVRDKAVNGEYDASHMLSPMPLALSMGLGSVQQSWAIPAIENVNGQAIVLGMPHKDRRDPKTWKGMRFGIPFDYSMHNYLLRYYLAEAGLDPDSDVSLRVIPPPEMVANLRAGNIDGFLGPDPANQRAVYDGVGFIHILSRQIWDGHPCCAFGVSRRFAAEAPNTVLALTKAIVDATGYANKHENRKEIADAIAPANFLNQPPVVVEQALTGTYADGLGAIVREPDRAGFEPFPWQSFGVWVLTQMKRWGQIKGDVDYKTVAAQVFDATGARKAMQGLGQTAPAADSKAFTVMGKPFDPEQPEAYLSSFPIRRT
ncbi:MAG: CmpA/NrtA family ABC transporter substrate-binding protein [Acetobacteraceae bacterium]